MSWQPAWEVTDRLDKRREYDAAVRQQERLAAIKRKPHKVRDDFGRLRTVVDEPAEHPEATFELRRDGRSHWISSWWWTCGCERESRRGFASEKLARQSHRAHVLMMA